jgi:hypothetical protein
VTSPSDRPAPVPQLRTSEDQATGVYANGIGVWSTQTEFVLDFMASLPIEMAVDQNGNHFAVAPQQLVSRVKIPPPLVFQVMRNLNTAMDQYEAQYGKIPDFLSGPPADPS